MAGCGLERLVSSCQHGAVDAPKKHEALWRTGMWACAADLRNSHLALPCFVEQKKAINGCCMSR